MVSTKYTEEIGFDFFVTFVETFVPSVLTPWRSDA